MVVDDRHDVGADAIDLAVDEALEIRRPRIAVERVAVEIEAEDVSRSDAGWRETA